MLSILIEDGKSDDMLNSIQERKQIEEYILNDFIPNYFSGFKEIDSNFSKNGHHKTFFKYQ
jgi:hypothetical protein